MANPDRDVESRTPKLATHLRGYIDRTKVSQRKLAKHLGIDTAVINRMLLGKGDAPSTRRSRRFYGRLPSLPEISPEEIEAMINASDVPSWVRREPPRNRTTGGFSINRGGLVVRIEFEAPTNVIPPEEANDFRFLLQGAAGLVLGDIVRRRTLLNS